MNAPSEDIKTMLLAESDMGLIFGRNLFIGKEKATPDDIVVIYDIPGAAPSMDLDGGNYERPSVQIKVRSRDYSDGMGLINVIYTLLHGRAHESCGGAIYELIVASSNPYHYDWDENGRARFIVNFNLQRR